MKDLGFGCHIHNLVLFRARRVLAAGCDGVVSSGLGSSVICQETDTKLIIVTPGIRPVENRLVDDQKRTTDAATALRKVLITSWWVGPDLSSRRPLGGSAKNTAEHR